MRRQKLACVRPLEVEATLARLQRIRRHDVGARIPCQKLQPPVPLQICAITDEGAVVGNSLGPEILDVGIAGIGSSQYLPVRDNLVRAFRARPLRSPWILLRFVLPEVVVGVNPIVSHHHFSG
jgi:hypothetical protein